MKKLILILVAVLCVVFCAVAQSGQPKAIYVVKDGAYTKYNYGVAGDMQFLENGNKMAIKGYATVIDLTNIDYITFKAPVGATTLTPAEQKEKLVKIGQDVFDMVDLNKYSEAINMCYRFFNSSYNETTDEYEPAICEYSIPEEYWAIHGETNKIIKATRGVASGNFAAVRAFASAAVNLYKIEDYTGVYTAMSETHSWKKTAEANYLEIRFLSAQGDYFSVRVTPSTTYGTWKTRHANIQMPETLTVDFAQGAKKFATCVIATKMEQEKVFDMNVNFECNGLVVVNKLSVNNESVTDNVNVTVNGKYLTNADVQVEGKNLLKYDEMYDAIKESSHYHDEAGECCGENPEQLLAHFVKANAKADVLKQLQLTGMVYDPLKAYTGIDGLEEEDYTYINVDGYEVWSRGLIKSMSSDKSYIEVDQEDPNWYASYASYLFNYSDISFAYDENGKVQGFLGFEVSDDSHEETIDTENKDYGYIVKDGHLVSVYKSYNSNDYTYSAYKDDEYVEMPVATSDVIFPTIIKYNYYEVMPVLYFPDMTSFYFEDFFDEVSFKKLIDDYDTIIDTYMSITGQDGDD